MPIPVENLRAVRKVIVHKHSAAAPCGDGRASALILHAALPGVEIVEMAYGESAHVNLAAEPGMLFCDFSPPPGRTAEFVAAGAIVLDHHERERVEPFGALGTFGENERGESGAWLAWREVYQATKPRRAWPAEVSEARAAERIAALAAIRDTWRRDSPEWDAACAMTAALVFVPLPDLLAMGVERFAKLAADLGPMLLAKQRAAAKQAAENAVRWTQRDGVRLAIVPNGALVSDVCDVLGDSADVVAAFDYIHEAGGNVRRLKVSLRSRGKVNVTTIAKHHGGGGHANGQAAGFHVAVTLADDGASPYVMIDRCLDEAMS